MKPPQPETAPSASYSYCNLLHVQPIPHPAEEPKPYLGIYMAAKKLGPTEHPCAEENFVQAAGIIKGSPAAKAGFKVDDVFLSLNNQALCGDADRVIPSFKKLIEKQNAGVPVVIDILRGEEKLSLPVMLETRPTHDQPEAKHPDIEQCATRESLFERDLSERGALPLFHDIVDGLYVRSNVVHNPGADYERKVHPLQLNEVTYLMRHPLAAGEVARKLSGRLSASLDNRNWQGSDVLSRAAALLDIDILRVQNPAEISFPALLKVMEKAKKNIDDALGNLTPEDKTLLQDKAFAPVDDEQWNRILEVSLKVDRMKLMNAIAPLFAFLTQDNLALLKKDINGRFSGTDKPVPHEAMTSFGKVVIGGAGPNTYSEDAALILDLGGDDLYLNNAGGTRSGMPLSLVIDWGGDDRYVSRENFSQAAGVLGGGILIDRGGRDAFISHDGSQGAGFWGLGFLYHGDGNATFNARKFSQGMGQMGIGMLINGGGDDRYLCSYGGQGLGLFGGAGILFDKTGNDLYQLGGLEPDFRDPTRATQSFGQGFGLGSRSDKDKDGVPGGVGMLIDEKGDDEYLADYFGQGASYYYGLGILDDWSGNDHYIAGRYTQGAGIHSSVGVLLDGGGNDFYYSSVGVGQGMGHDFGVGFLEDNRGDDRYEGGTLVRGAATNGSLGVFLGPAGDDLHARMGTDQGHADDEPGMGIVIRRGHGSNEPAVTIEKKKE
jgi:hypothetical protein